MTTTEVSTANITTVEVIEEHSSRALEQPGVESSLDENNIGVTFDYQPPPPLPNPEVSSNDNQRRTRRVRHHAHRHHRHPRRRNRHRRRRSDRRRDDNLVRQLAKHWVSQCVAALLTGVVFLAIGVALMTTNVASYIGIMFVLVSLPSFFMAIHMVQVRIRHRRMRRIYNERLRQRAIRRRRRAAENSSYRNRSLPFPDLPPSYDNLGFQNDDDANPTAEVDPENLSLSSLSEDSEAPPPSYNEDWDDVSFENKEVEDFEETVISSDDDAKSTSLCDEPQIENISSSQLPHCSHAT